jgi:eukaryotic-like serine/threonine-protein kinase
MRVPEALAGKKGKCPKCGAIVAIAPAEAPATPVPADARLHEAPTEPQASPDVPSEQVTVAAPSETPSGDTQAQRSTDVPSQAPASYSFLAPPQETGELGRLGPYRVLGVLGQGGMGVVFVAEDVRLGRQVALKAMLPEMANKPAARERFLREARTAAAIEHDHIVAIYQVDEDRGVPFIAMPLLKGLTLEDWLRRRPDQPLPVPAILKLARETAAGLAAAHAHGLIHRDIKPANIFLQSVVRGASASGKDKDPGTGSYVSLPVLSDHGLAAMDYRVKILDFGLARLTAGEQHLTLSGMIMGTPSYMAPEQARSGSPVDARADLFSMGIVLYRLCTGRLPFLGEDMMSTLMAVAMDQPPPPRLLNPELPFAVAELVMRLLQKDPADRPRSADDVVAAIGAIEAELAAPAAPTAPVPVVPMLLEGRTAITPVAPPPVPQEEVEPERAPRRRRLDDDEDDQLDLRRLKNEDVNLSLASMITGIVSVVFGVLGNCCCGGLAVMPLAALGGMTAIGLGIAGLKRGGRVYAQVGIGLGSAALVLVATSILLFALGMGIQLMGRR